MTETSYDSKKVAMRAEAGDSVVLEGYGEFTVVRRSDPYFGPKITLAPAEADAEFNVMLTAPGPDSQLQLWWPERDDPGWRSGWVRGAEVTAKLVDTKQYDICSCGEPIKSAEHAKRSLMRVGEHG